MNEEKKKSSVKFFTVLKYFWPHVVMYKWQIIVCFVASAIAIVAGTAWLPVIYSNIITSVTSATYPGITPHLRNLFIALIAGNLVNIGFWRIFEYALLYLKTKGSKTLNDQSFGLLLRHSKTFFANNFSGALVAKQGRYVSSFPAIFNTIVYNFWGTSIALIGVLIVLFSKNDTIGIIFSVWVVVFTSISFFFAKYKIPFDERKAAANSRTVGQLSDVLTNILSIKVFSAFKRENDAFYEKTDEEERLRWRAGRISNIRNIVLALLAAALEVVALWAVIVMWSKGLVDVGFIVLVQVYVLQVSQFSHSIGNSILDLEAYITDAKEMVEVFETPIGIEDPRKPEKVRIKYGHITFEDVDFEYHGGGFLFKKVSLDIPSGQKVGLVGHSGSGKTTITNLLLRFEDVQSGAIKIDGQDIRNITQDDLRKNISYVPQEPALFHRSIKENIAYGKAGAKDSAVIVAAKKAHAHEFINEFKDGYETLVGERGVKLSGGQRQRIAIARVMLKNAPILVLDEATSSLDSISENLIQEAFAEAMKGKTTLVIAHRLSTIQKMDRIVVLDKGKIVEDGTHAELLEKGGYYHELWQAQKGGMI